MISDALTSPAYAYPPDADWAGPDASARLLHRMPLLSLLYGLVRFLVLVAFLAHEYWLAIRQYRAVTLPSAWSHRSGLPPGFAQQSAASIRAAVGDAIASTYHRRGTAPAHKDWMELSLAIMAFGSSKKSFRPVNMNFADQAIMASGGSSKDSTPASHPAACIRGKTPASCPAQSATSQKFRPPRPWRCYTPSRKLPTHRRRHRTPATAHPHGWLPAYWRSARGPNYSQFWISTDPPTGPPSPQAINFVTSGEALSGNIPT
ncbi:MAG TPA: hypothetical protein VME47_08725 [Acetobacteraceae bacterium]|nr:hypothetical protein [Acetobacteraceae bacterium]